MKCCHDMLRSRNCGISKRLNNSKIMLALAANMNFSETNKSDNSNSKAKPPCPPHARKAVNSELFILVTCMVLVLLLPVLLTYGAVHTLMDGTRYTVTLEEFKLFHGIDRALYIVLMRDLGRNPLESLYIMGLWLWLERGGFYNFISKILPLPPFLINELADEAVTCLNCVNINFPLLSEASEIPLTHSLVKKDISLQFFHENHLTALHEIQSLVSGVCIPSLSDIMETSCRGCFGEPSTRSQMQAPASVDNLVQSISSLRINGGDNLSPYRGSAQGNEMSRNDRTMFVTFSKGYPVTENEVRQFFTRLFGNCIESFHMQDLRHEEQPLYAKIVFLRPGFIRAILSGVSKAKFTINGKHVWMRKFVPKNDRPLPCGCPSIVVCSCP